MNEQVREEVERLIDDYKLNCSVDEFADKVDWKIISCCQKLSESFIEKHADKAIRKIHQKVFK